MYHACEVLAVPLQVGSRSLRSSRRLVVMALHPARLESVELSCMRPLNDRGVDPGGGRFDS